MCGEGEREPEDIVNQDGELWKGNVRIQENDEFSLFEILWELYCGISWWRHLRRYLNLSLEPRRRPVLQVS